MQLTADPSASSAESLVTYLEAFLAGFDGGNIASHSTTNDDEIPFLCNRVRRLAQPSTDIRGSIGRSCLPDAEAKLLRHLASDGAATFGNLG